MRQTNSCHSSKHHALSVISSFPSIKSKSLKKSEDNMFIYVKKKVYASMQDSKKSSWRGLLPIYKHKSWDPAPCLTVTLTHSL